MSREELIDKLWETKRWLALAQADRDQYDSDANTLLGQRLDLEAQVEVLKKESP